MIVRLTTPQWHALFYWGREVNACDGASDAGRLLVKVLHELVPAPSGPVPLRRTGRPPSQASYDQSIAVGAVLRDTRVRSLWVWGHARGCTTVAECMRTLITLVVAAYPDLGVHRPLGGRPECLGALAAAIMGPPAVERSAES